MTSGLSKVKTMGATVFAYSFFFKNILFALKVVIPFIFIYLLLETYIKTDVLRDGFGAAFYIKAFLMDMAFGWILFSVSRRVVLGEDVSKMKWAEVFNSKRVNALISGVLVFALCQGVAIFAENSATLILATEGFNTGTIIRILLFLYVAVLMFIASFTAIALCVQANLMSYLYVACRPQYLWMVLALWSFTVLPVLLVYYTVVFFVNLGGTIDIVTMTTLLNNPSFTDTIALGVTRGIGFTLLAAGLAHAMSYFLVLRTTPSNKEISS